MRNIVIATMSVFFAIVLALLPMPEWAAWLRPAWVLMVLIYWTMTIPFQVNVGFAWFAGIILDLLTGTMLGEHALALTLVTYMSYRFHLRLNMYPLVQQAVTVLVFAFIYQSIIFSLQAIIGQPPRSHMYWLSSVTTMVFWPWFYMLMRDYSYRFQITVAD